MQALSGLADCRFGTWSHQHLGNVLEHDRTAPSVRRGVVTFAAWAGTAPSRILPLLPVARSRSARVPQDHPPQGQGS